MKNFIQAVEEICAKDSRYKPEGYEFVSQALNFTRKKLKKTGAYHRERALGGDTGLCHRPIRSDG